MIGVADGAFGSEVNGIDTVVESIKMTDIVAKPMLRGRFALAKKVGE